MAIHLCTHIRGVSLCVQISSFYKDPDAETWPLYTGAELNLGDRVLGEVEKNSFIACQAKGHTAGSCPQKLCVPNQGGL